LQPFDLTILGCSSAAPTSLRHPTAQLLTIHHTYLLIDCGEATQIQLRRYNIKLQRIDHVFISHLHGDHYLGLQGLLSTMHLLGRKKKLFVYSPPGLREIISVHNHHSKTYLNYPIIFNELTQHTQKILDTDKFSVETIQMNHRIPCYGFLFREKQFLKNILTSKIEEYSIPQQAIPHIKAGMDFILPDGKSIPNEQLTTPPPPPRSYAYCADTLYTESYLSTIKNVDLLYHEATFAEDRIARAKETYHCTATQAATIAQKAGVKKLIIGHYSARYTELDVLLKEAKQVFSNTHLATEGETHALLHSSGADE
jgi:ribonuclease Z